MPLVNVLLIKCFSKAVQQNTLVDLERTFFFFYSVMFICFCEPRKI